MEFRDIIAAGILHEISDEAKRKLKKAGKIGAGAAALGGAAYLAHQHLTGNHADTPQGLSGGGGGDVEAGTGKQATVKQQGQGQVEDRLKGGGPKGHPATNTRGGGGAPKQGQGQIENRFRGGGPKGHPATNTRGGGGSAEHAPGQTENRIKGSSKGHTPGSADANTGSVKPKPGADTKHVAPQGKKEEAAIARKNLAASGGLGPTAKDIARDEAQKTAASAASMPTARKTQESQIVAAGIRQLYGSTKNK